jgi:hypothetical protein
VSRPRVLLLSSKLILHAICKAKKLKRRLEELERRAGPFGVAMRSPLSKGGDGSSSHIQSNRASLVPDTRPPCLNHAGPSQVDMTPQSIDLDITYDHDRTIAPSTRVLGELERFRPSIIQSLWHGTSSLPLCGDHIRPSVAPANNTSCSYTSHINSKHDLETFRPSPSPDSSDGGLFGSSPLSDNPAGDGFTSWLGYGFKSKSKMHGHPGLHQSYANRLFSPRVSLGDITRATVTADLYCQTPPTLPHLDVTAGYPIPSIVYPASPLSIRSDYLDFN